MKNTFVKVLSLVMALMMVVGTFSTLTVFAAEHDHTKGELVGKVEPTCLKNGYSTYICGVEGCGVKWNTDVVFADAKYHNYENKAAEDATCWADAKPAAEVCSHCGLTPEGEPRPVEAGTRKLHQFVGTVTEADCLNNKKLEYTCKLCEKTAEKINTDNGFMAAQKAQYVAGEWNKVEYAGTALNPGHANLTWTVVTAPKSADGVCAAGLAEGYCDKCKTVVRTAEIPPVHTFKSLNENNLPCIEWDQSVRACSVCGILENPAATKRPTSGHDVAKEFSGKVTIDNLPVKNDNTTVITLAMLAELGIVVGDDAKDDLKIDAKCYADGKQLVECSCGELYWKTLSKAEVSHTWKDQDSTTDGVQMWLYSTVTKCTDAYTRTRECTVAGCGHKDVIEITPAAATAHNMVVVPANSSAANKTVPATCVTPGYTYSVCGNKTCQGGACAETLQNNYVDALGHTYGTPYFAANQAADKTCSTGVWQKKCVTCNGQLTGGVVDVNATNTPGWTAPACTWGAEVVVPATCQERSYKYTPCTVCGAWKDNADKSHDYADGAQVDPSNHVYPTAEQMKAYANGNTSVSAFIVGWVSNKASTCTEAGKLIVKCTGGCGDATIAYVDAPLKDHDYIACDDCSTHEEGKHTYYNYVALKAGSTTEYQAYTGALAATCKKTGYKNDGMVCVDCLYVKNAATVTPVVDGQGIVYNDEAVGAEITGANKGGHEGTVTVLVVKAATCLEHAFVTYNTTCCGIITVVDTEGALGAHNYTKDDSTQNILPYKAPTCVAEGYHAHTACVVCKAIKPDSMASTVSACGCVTAEAYNKLTDEQKAALDLAHADLKANDNYVISKIPHDFKKAADGTEYGYLRETCDVAGRNAAYLCANGCNQAQYNGNTYDLTNNDSKAALKTAMAIPAHYSQYTQYFDKKAPTCTSKGTSDAKKGYYCTVCQKDQWLDMDVLPHTTETFYANLAVFDGKPADFAAWVDARFAATDVIELTLYYGEFALVYQNQTAADAKAIVAEQAEAITRVAVVDSSETGYKPELLDCTKAGCKVERCKVCTWYDTVYVPAKNTEHKYAANWTEKKAADGTTCYVATIQEKLCTEPGCQAKLTETKTAATGHYTTKGVTGGEKFFFDYNCNKISEFAAYKCDVCGTNYMDLIRKGVIKVDGVVPNTKQAVQHDPVNLKQAATCTEDGYEISECRNCNYADQDKEFDYPAVNKKLESVGSHTQEGAVVLEKVEPTAGADGHITYICPACKQTVTETIHASMAVDSVIVPQYDAYASGNNVTATVYLTAEAFSFNKLYIDVASNLKLVDFEMLASFVDAEGNAVKASAMIDANGDVVVFVENSVTGEKKNAAFAAGSDVALLTLTFSSHKFFKGTASFSTKVVGSEIYNAETEKYDVVDLIDAVEAEIASVTFDVPGDFNGDKLFGANDLAAFLPALAEAMLSDTVENKYDLNNDGEVSLADVEGLRAYIADGQTLSAYLKMTGEDVDDALAANGTPVFVDENGVIITMDEATKKVLFAAAMDEIIAYFSVDQYIELCTRDDVNVESLTELVNFIVKLATQEAYNETDPAKRSIVFTVDKVIIRTNTDPIVIAY